MKRGITVMGLLGTLFGGALALGSCSNSVDTTKNILVRDVPAVASECAKLGKEGDWFRFTKLGLKSISGGTSVLTQTLNSVWEKDIIKKELNILMRLKAIDGTKVTLEVMSGARIGKGDTATYCIVKNSLHEMTFPFSATGMGPSTKTALDVYAGNTENPKNCAAEQATFDIHAIPVKEIEVNATCNGGKQTGTIKGFIAEADLKSVCTCVILDEKYADEGCGAAPSPTYKSPLPGCNGCNEKYQSLNLLIPAFNASKTCPGGKSCDSACAPGDPSCCSCDLDYECKDKDGSPAACIDAFFEAEPIAGPPADCK